jgi:quercetin dioxygenase-like cupin family protein/alkylhydroperoxidase/carboxymuconolactone decarboxylase family protein YurZ
MKNHFFGILTSALLASFSMSGISLAEATAAIELSKAEKAIVPIASFTAIGDIPRLKASLNQGLDNGLTVGEIKEALVHIYAYAGFPRALNGINAFSTVMDERKVQGKVDDNGKEATPLPADFDQNAYGHKVRNALVGRDISHRTSGYAVFTPIIDTFLVEHLFADIFVRDVLSHKQRELVTISTLAAIPGTEAQLKGHLGIAMNVGYSEAQLKDFIEVLRTEVGLHVADNGARVLGEVLGTPLPEVNSKAVKVTRKGPPVVAPADYFTGRATVVSRFTSEASGSYGGAIVNFEAGARTAWHTHPAGQTLVITSGRGLVQSEGEAVQVIEPGDVVWIPAGERHWHGAEPDGAMSHVAISEPQNGSTVSWMEHVIDEQYIQ